MKDRTVPGVGHDSTQSTSECQSLRPICILGSHGGASFSRIRATIPFPNPPKGGVMANTSSPAARRRFLRFLAGSPVVASLGGVAAFMRQEGFAQDMREIRESSFASAVRDRMSYIESPAEALTVFDFEETARRRVQPGHWAYMASGTDDDATLYANRQAFRQVQLRPRRLRDATKVDMRVDLFGTTYASPIFTCPTGGQGSMHADAELGVARAARARGTLQFLSTGTGT